MPASTACWTPGCGKRPGGEPVISPRARNRAVATRAASWPWPASMAASSRPSSGATTASARNRSTPAASAPESLSLSQPSAVSVIAAAPVSSTRGSSSRVAVTPVLASRVASSCSSAGLPRVSWWQASATSASTCCSAVPSWPASSRRAARWGSGAGRSSRMYGSAARSLARSFPPDSPGSALVRIIAMGRPSSRLAM